MRGNLSLGFANNKGADQPTHPRNLISAFFIHLLKSSLPKLATSENWIFWPVSVAEQVGLGMLWSKTHNFGQEAIYYIVLFQLIVLMWWNFDSGIRPA